MVIHIKATPTLRGKDAERLEKAMKENATKKVSKEEYERAKAAYESIKLPRGWGRAP